MAEELLVDQAAGSDEAVALLRAAMEHGREADRRALTIRVAADSAGDGVFKQFGFTHAGDGLQYLRPADPVVADGEIKKRPAYIKVGKIFGQF